MNILVTGGAGLIGRNLCERQLQAGNTVICLDNFYSSTTNNISHLYRYPNFRFIKHDITKPFDIDVDQIYNLACPASPKHYQLDPLYTTRVSVLGVLNMADLALRNDARLLQASTSEVYGDPLVDKQAESYWGHVNPIGVRACYDEGKRCAESLLFDYYRQKQLDIRVVRIFNTYGPGMQPDDGRVVSNFIVQALKGENITIYGDGSQTRSFQYVDDLIDGMIAMMNQSYVGPINIGNPAELTIKELALYVLKLIPQSKSKLTYEALPHDDPRQRRPDITLAKSKLDWQPRTTLLEGLRYTIAHFESLLLNEPLEDKLINQLWTTSHRF